MSPWLLHVWWRLSLPALRRALRRAGPGARVLLRLSEPGHGEKGFCLDLEVPALGGHWYVDFWRDGHKIGARIGVADPWGGFTLLASADPLALGRGSPAPEGPLLFGRALPKTGVKITRVLHVAEEPEPGVPLPREPEPRVPLPRAVLPLVPLPARPRASAPDQAAGLPSQRTVRLSCASPLPPDGPLPSPPAPLRGAGPAPQVERPGSNFRSGSG